MEWKYIQKNNDIEELIDEFSNFYNGCLKEICYVSGTSVDETLSMDRKDNQTVKIIFQRQSHSPKEIEVEFKDIQKIIIIPPGEDELDLILGYSMCLNRGIIYWAASTEWNLRNMNYINCTWIGAKHVRWRKLDG